MAFEELSAVVSNNDDDGSNVEVCRVPEDAAPEQDEDGTTFGSVSPHHLLPSGNTGHRSFWLCCG